MFIYNLDYNKYIIMTNIIKFMLKFHLIYEYNYIGFF